MFKRRGRARMLALAAVTGLALLPGTVIGTPNQAWADRGPFQIRNQCHLA